MILPAKPCPLCKEMLVELSAHNWVHAYELLPSRLSVRERVAA